MSNHRSIPTYKNSYNNKLDFSKTGFYGGNLKDNSQQILVEKKAKTNFRKILKMESLQPMVYGIDEYAESFLVSENDDLSVTKSRGGIESILSKSPGLSRMQS